jgi:hypothetical protein
MAYDRPYETKAGTASLFPNDRKDPAYASRLEG